MSGDEERCPTCGRYVVGGEMAEGYFGPPPGYINCDEVLPVIYCDEECYARRPVKDKAELGRAQLSMASCGQAGQGTAGRGEANQGKPRTLLTSLHMAVPGIAGQGAAWQG